MEVRCVEMNDWLVMTFIREVLLAPGCRVL